MDDLNIEDKKPILQCEVYSDSIATTASFRPEGKAQIQLCELTRQTQEHVGPGLFIQPKPENMCSLETGTAQLKLQLCEVNGLKPLHILDHQKSEMGCPAETNLLLIKPNVQEHRYPRDSSDYLEPKALCPLQKSSHFSPSQAEDTNDYNCPQQNTMNISYVRLCRLPKDMNSAKQTEYYTCNSSSGRNSVYMLTPVDVYSSPFKCVDGNAPDKSVIRKSQYTWRLSEAAVANDKAPKNANRIDSKENVEKSPGYKVVNKQPCSQLKNGSRKKCATVKRHICQYCKGAFSCKSKLEVHTRIHTGEKPYKCHQCEKAYSNSSEFNRHREIHMHFNFKCKTCPKHFDDINDLNKHVARHTVYKCEVCEAAFYRNEHMKSHMRTHTRERPYNCRQCGASFSQSHSLKSHMRTHTGEKPYKCTHCNAAYKGLNSLKTHLKTHKSDRPYKCDVCDAAFKHECYVKIHMRIHTDEKPYKCHHHKCKAAFRQPSNLNTHLKYHTGEKPHKCSHCEAAFGRLEHLKIHLRIHTGERPYKCLHCDKSFVTDGSLKHHMRTHTGEKPYKCPHCEKAFSMKCGLKNHIRVHTGEKPFKCQHCDATFSQSGNRKHHEGTHTKPFKCSQCEEAFSNKEYLRNHFRKHTSN